MNVPLCLDSLGDLDNGSARAVIDTAIGIAIRDVDDRGDDGKPRTVNIVLHLEKLDNGVIAARIEAGAKIPSLKTASTLGLAKVEKGRPQMMFQTMSPTDPRQRTMDEVEERE